MILDRIADLKALAERASSTTRTSNEDAAFADVEEQVTSAHSLFRSLGMANVRVLRLLAGDERLGILRAATSAFEALQVLANASDAELAAYSSTTAEKRGSLRAVSREASGLRATLLAAQQMLLHRLGQEIWPDDDVVRLDVVAHLSHNGTVAQRGRDALEVRERLMAHASDDVGLALDQLDRLIKEAARAAAGAAPLRDEDVSDDVIEFWKAASTEQGAGLDALTPAIRAWLETHNALTSFSVVRR
jgi:hypothetical protein